MSVYEKSSIGELMFKNPYVGRGIAVGLSESGKKAVFAYFIMGRSQNSRNRIFTLKNGELFTEPFDESLVSDPSLIIYAAVRQYENKLIVTNGDQTDTIYDGFKAGLGFSESLAKREFEPDPPNLTPRISAVMNLGENYSYEMSILKSIDPDGSGCARFTYSYPAVKGLGHFISTYVTDGNPLPTFQGEPKRIAVPDDIVSFTHDIWSNLDEDNRISLYVRYTDLETGEITDRLFNKNQKGE